jgi:hypothetical protein
VNREKEQQVSKSKMQVGLDAAVKALREITKTAEPTTLTVGSGGDIEVTYYVPMDGTGPAWVEALVETFGGTRWSVVSDRMVARKYKVPGVDRTSANVTVILPPAGTDEALDKVLAQRHWRHTTLTAV